MRFSNRLVKPLAAFTVGMIGLECGVGYYMVQKQFTVSGCQSRAVQKLEECTAAVESLGVPPLKVKFINLCDKFNHVDQQTAQVKIPVAGSKTSGHLYTSSVRDPDTSRWNLRQAELKLKEGRVITLLSRYPAAKALSETPEYTNGLEKGPW